MCINLVSPLPVKLFSKYILKVHFQDGTYFSNPDRSPNKHSIKVRASYWLKTIVISACRLFEDDLLS